VNRPEPTGDLIHNRNYDVRTYREAPDLMRIRGVVRDSKPPGIYFADDPEPLVIHEMVVDLLVGFPSLEIVDAEVVLETHPHSQCPRISDHYRELVGLSIARGFNRKLRELFGGPRGCSHTTALLQAMAPVAIQSTWSMRMLSDDPDVLPEMPADPTPEQLRERFRWNLNTCHVWAEDGEVLGEILSGGEMEIPIWAADRARRLGRDPQVWRDGRRG